MRIRLDGRPLLDQQLTVGPRSVGWDGPAMTGGRRAIGSLVLVDSAWAERPPEPALLGDDAAVMPRALGRLTGTARESRLLRVERAGQLRGHGV